MPKINLQGLLKLHESRVNRGKNPDVWDAGCVIPEKLYVGSLSSAKDVAKLRENQITHVLTPAARLQVYQDVPDFISHLQLEIPDHPAASLFTILSAALEFIDNAFEDDSARVLVHCASGVSRSVSVCCAHLMLRHDMTFEDALIQVRENRPMAGPNAGFRFQLETLSEYRELKTAEEAFKESISTATVMEQIIQQRDVANDFHAKVDVLEESIQSRGVQDDVIEKNWIEELTSLSNAIKEIKTEGLQDRPAKMIRKSAANKIERLLKQLTET